MTIQRWFTLCISAVLYVLPFMFSTYAWWLVFLFPIPLLYVALHENLTFKHGYIWGIFAFGLHLSGVLYSVFLMATGSYLLRLIPILFIVLYEPLSSGACFWLAGKFIAHFNILKQTWQRVGVWVATLFIFFYYVDRYCLLLFDRCEGYFLMHPLLPLATKPAFLQFLPTIGKPLLTIALLLVPATITMFIIKPHKKRFFAILIALLPWLGASFFPQQQLKKPHWLNQVAPMQIIFPESANLTDMMHRAGKQFKKIIHNRPDTKLIIMPESSFYCSSLVSIPKLVNFWSEKHLGRQLDIVVGIPRQEKNNSYNTLIWVKNGKLQTYFDKRHAMILTEHTPSWFNFLFIQNLYFSKVPATTISTKHRPQLPILNDVTFIPYICSELFFNEHPDDDYNTGTILEICNDMWFNTPYYPSYVPRLMHLIAQFKAIQWQRDILYVSFFHATYIDIHGNTTTID